MELEKGNLSENRSKNQQEGFAEEMELLEELMLAADDKVRELRRTQKAGTEEFRKAQKEAYMLTRIAKIVRMQQNALNDRDRAASAVVAERLLNGSASAYIYGDAESAEVRVTDELTPFNTIASFKVEIGSLRCLLIKEFQFY